VGRLLAKGLRVAPQAGRPALLPVHQVHLVGPLLEPKHQLYLRVLPQAKLQVARCLAVQQSYLGFQALRKQRVANCLSAQP
jgi:hypothetical protein